MNLNWFLSATVRQATGLRKHVEKLLNHQRDILPAAAVTGLQGAIAEIRQATEGNAGKAELEKQMENLEKAANKWLKPYPNAAWRENVEVLLVALAIAMGIRTFLLQPFKIPTGSMQPTLFGVTSVPDYSRGRDNAWPPGVAEVRFPTGWERVREWFEGVSYLHLVADRDGALEAVDAPFRILIFNIWQNVRFAGSTHTFWFPPDYGSPTLQERAGVRIGQTFRKGEDVIKLRVAAGDHLFVDRVSYNFRSPQRGEIVVFATKGIYPLPQDQFYIKRLVALGGESVRIADDRHLVINGTELGASTPHFEKVYSFNPKEPPRDSHYSGHVSDAVVKQFYPYFGGGLAPHFPDASAVFNVRSNYFMVMGDNTMNSLDSRSWGDFPADNVIGKSFFVYWPLTDRFGWGYHR